MKETPSPFCCKCTILKIKNKVLFIDKYNKISKNTFYVENFYNFFSVSGSLKNVLLLKLASRSWLALLSSDVEVLFRSRVDYPHWLGVLQFWITAA